MPHAHRAPTSVAGIVTRRVVSDHACHEAALAVVNSEEVPTWVVRPIRASVWLTPR